MKTIKRGTILPKPSPWWVGWQINCPHCRAQFELEKGDKVTALAPKSPSGYVSGRPAHIVQCVCPECSKGIEESRVLRADGSQL